MSEEQKTQTEEELKNQASPESEENPEEVTTEEEQKAEKTPEKKEEDEELLTKFLRLNADFQNFRRRSEAEKAEIYSFANEKLLVSLLDIIDNFERALVTAPEDDKFADGMKLIFKQMQDLLTKNNVTEIASENADFDPNFHHAVMTEAGEESGKVTKVLQKGYLMNNKVIRPAMVVVSE